MISGKYTREETNNRIFERVLREYLSRVLNDNKNMKYEAAVHILKLLDSLRIDTTLGMQGFDFIRYYQQYMETEENALRENARVKAEKLLKTPLM